MQVLCNPQCSLPCKLEVLVGRPRRLTLKAFSAWKILDHFRSTWGKTPLISENGQEFSNSEKNVRRRGQTE